MSIFIITGPSGAGKTTIANELLERSDLLQKVVTHTTRPMREGEINGVHYYFVSIEKFCRGSRSGIFIEEASVYGHRYGTSVAAVVEALPEGKVPLIVTDTQGADWWKTHFPEDVVIIFLLPPSHEELESRLESRGSDTVHDIQFRLAQAMTETTNCVPWADYIVPNDSLDSTVDCVLEFICKTLRKING